VASMPEIISDWTARPTPGARAESSRRLPRLKSRIIVALMKPKQRKWLTGIATSALPIAGLITMLLALVILQLRWSARVSEAERARLQQNLQRSTSGFQAAFAQDLAGICQTFQASHPRPPEIAVDRLFDRYSVWRRISRHGALISGLYLWPRTGGHADRLLEFNLENRQLDAVQWPDSLSQLAMHGRGDLAVFPRRPRAWVWDESVPVLIHPVFVSGAQATVAQPQLYGYLFVVFNPDDFEHTYLPQLGRRYFPLANGFVFQFVERAAGEVRVVYESDSPGSRARFQHSDAVIPLLESSRSYRFPVQPAPPGAASATLPIYLSVADAAQWQVAVRHRSGSVDAAVTSLRRRDLAVSIVVLVMLIVSVVTILAATRRARRLARLQMEFASGVSHELRTPLAVISSAAENLADGVVTDGSRIRDYGALIHRESQRLSGMVDNILDFAQLQSDAQSYSRESLEARVLIDAVLSGQRSQIEAAGVSVETKIAPGTPCLLTNAAVLQQCLQNLVSNALKYGREGRRIVVAATPAHEGGEDRVLISVRDFGSGIAAEELPHIYEPFYRAAGARDSQIPGTGLGLSLTRKMMEGLGGAISAESSPGRGSVFTLHVPAAVDRKHSVTPELPSRSA
jgi:signal transduction histidine kinase